MATIVYSDINADVDSNNKGEILTNADAINSSIEAILSTTPGERLFLPTFGSELPSLIFQPIDDITAFEMELASIIAIEQWEPRVRIIRSETSVVAFPDQNKYEITITYELLANGDLGSFNRFISNSEIGN